MEPWHTHLGLLNSPISRSEFDFQIRSIAALQYFHAERCSLPYELAKIPVFGNYTKKEEGKKKEKEKEKKSKQKQKQMENKASNKLFNPLNRKDPYIHEYTPIELNRQIGVGPFFFLKAKLRLLEVKSRGG